MTAPDPLLESLLAARLKPKSPEPSLLIDPTDGRTIAHVYPTTQFPNPNKTVELLAAAPDLLAALIDVIGIAQEAVEVRQQSDDAYDRDTARSFQADIDRARAAIAKARG
jgi:hypothetical protein